MRGHIAEEPFVLNEGPTYELATKVANWIEARKRSKSNSGWVAGVYGGRGTGKTSFLLTLINILHERTNAPKSNGEVLACAMPEIDIHRPEQALLTPAATRDDDDLLFLLLEHIQLRHAPVGRDKEGLDKLFMEARKAEVMRKDQRSFIEYEREVSPSGDALPSALVKVHGDVAMTTQNIRKAVYKITDILTSVGVLPVFVDDIDLRPERALELLEITHLFLNRSGVVVVVTADRDLLLHAIQRALKNRGIKHPGLAAALLAKYVPHTWSLPVPDEAARLSELWPEKTAREPDPCLPLWWPDKAAHVFGSPEPSMREKAAELFKTLLPATFRGLAAMHNRLLTLEDDWDVHARKTSLVDALKRRFAVQLGIRDELIPPFISLIVAVDIRYPELGLFEVLNQEPEILRAVLSRVLAREKEWMRERSQPIERSKAIERSEDRLGAGLERLAAANEETWIRVNDPDEQWPVLDRLRAPYLDGRHLGEAWRLLRELANRWKILADLSPEARPRGRFLAISFRGDAFEASRAEWASAFPDADVSHLDLRPIISGGRPTPSEYAQAKDRTRAFVRDLLDNFRGQIEIFASAPLSFLIWLGWMLDEHRPFTVYDASSKQSFHGPMDQLKVLPRDRYEVCDEVSAPENASGEAGAGVTIVDLTPDHKSNIRYLDRFQYQGTPVDCRVRRLLTRRTSDLIKEEYLVATLRDVLRLLGKLRDREKILHLHLALAGHDFEAFFLGRQLKDAGMKISLHEFHGDHHEHVFDLEESPSGPA